jgi:hypothetical protein
MTERLKQISLRKFREQVADLTEVVEVSKRDGDGNIRILGYWTPYATHPADATPLEPLVGAKAEPGPMVGIEVKAGEVGVLDIPVDDESFPMAEDSEFDRHPRTAPRVIATPEEAAVAVRVDPVRAVPKPSQRKVKR